MSPYGPGEPSRRYPEDYGPPSDPWGTAPADSWQGYDNPSYGNQSYPDQPYPDQGYRDYRDRRDYRDYREDGGQEDNWAPPPPPLPPPRRSTGLYALVAVLVVLAASGVGYALYLLSADNGEGGETAGEQTPTPAVTTEPSSSADPSEPSRDNIGLNAATAQVDDCLINDGSAEQPQMRVVQCDSDEEGQIFQVLAIFEERVEGDGAAANARAQEICGDTEGYRYHYYEVSDNASFVLCMADREA